MVHKKRKGRYMNLENVSVKIAKSVEISVHNSMWNSVRKSVRNSVYFSVNKPVLDTMWNSVAFGLQRLIREERRQG
jgi:hypothetical protein